MSWLTEYKRAMVTAVVRNGEFVRRGRNFFYFQGLDMVDDRRKATLAALADGTLDLRDVRLDESEWRGMGDTNNLGDLLHGVDVEFTIDGEQEHWRYKGTVSALTLELLNSRED